MNRQIKYRGLEIITKQWFYGYYFSDGKDHFIYYQIEGDKWGTVKVTPESVGQFTGLTDKNGTDIYEGDILRVNDYNEIKIVSVCYTPPCFSTDPSLVADNDCDSLSNIYYDEEVTIEIIGNIYQNPELLK